MPGIPHLILAVVALATLLRAPAWRKPASQPPVGQPPAAARALPDSLPRPERLRIVDAMDAFTRKHFAHWSPLGAQSYDSMVAVFRRDAETAVDRRAFDMAALAFTAGLRNGHTEFTDQWLNQTAGQPLWLWIWPQPDGWLVTATEFAGLAKGDVITHVDGVPVDTVYRQMRPYLIASGERMRRYMVTQADYLWPRTSQLTLADGKSVTITRGVPTTAEVTASRAGRQLVPHRWIVPDSIGYVRVARFSPAAYEDSAVAAITRLYAAAPALIVDVRGNGGGSTPRKLMRLLQAQRGGRRLDVEKTTIGADAFRFLSSLSSAGGGPAYRGALVILADHGCASACEDFLAPFADSKDALVIGDTTWGTTGQPQSLDLGHGMSYRVSARRYRLATGAPFEGVGIPPHIVVPLSADALRADRDLALARAVSEIREGRAPRSPRL
jgi:carboxyl-terminal processing protease